MPISYDAASNIITVTGYTEASPCNLNDLWNADKAGTLSLHARTNLSGVDANPVNLTRNARPTDRVVLGGTKQDLYVVVTNWNAISATVRLLGMDTNDAAQTEDLAITGNGTYYATKYFKTLTQSQLTAFVGTRIDYEGKQAQWGVVWKQGLEQFRLECKLAVGDGSTTTWVIVTRASLVIAVATGNLVSIYNAATVRLGELKDAATYSTANGVTVFSGVAGSAHTFWKVYGGTLQLYSSAFYNLGTSQCWFISGNTNRIWNCFVDGYKALLSYSANTNIYNVYRCGGETSLADSVSTPTVDTLVVKNSSYAVTCQGANALTISNLTGGYQSSKFILAWITTVDHYLIDCVWLDSPNWTINWGGGTSTGRIFRRHSFNIKVTDKDNNSVNGATVTLRDKEGSVVFTASSGANGSIAAQIVSRGYYDQAHGNTMQDYGPHILIIAKVGYQTYVKKLIAADKVNWEIKLAKVATVLSSLGQPVLNLKASDPENTNLLVL